MQSNQEPLKREAARSSSCLTRRKMSTPSSSYVRNVSDNRVRSGKGGVKLSTEG